MARSRPSIVTGNMRLPMICRMTAIDWRYCHRCSGSGFSHANFGNAWQNRASHSAPASSLAPAQRKSHRRRVRRIPMSRTRRISKGIRFRMSVGSSNAGKMKMGHRLEVAAGSGVSKPVTPPVIQSTGVMPGEISVSAVVEATV